LLRGGEPADDRTGRNRSADLREMLRSVLFHAAAVEQAKRSAAMRLAPQEDVTGDVERVDHLQVLVDDGDTETGRTARTVDAHRCAIDADLAGVGPVDAGKDFHQGRLAGAVLADECDDLAAGDF